MQPEAVPLHPEQGSNIFCHYRIRKGDVDAGFSGADVIIESEYRTPAREHAYLQPEAGISYIDEQGRVTVQVAGQWTHEDQGADRPCAWSASGTGARDLSGDWRGIWRS